jgi:hypothetical protein
MNWQLAIMKYQLIDRKPTFELVFYRNFENKIKIKWMLKQQK